MRDPTHNQDQDQQLSNVRSPHDRDAIERTITPNPSWTLAGGSNQFTGHSQTGPPMSANGRRGCGEYTCPWIPVSFEI